MPVSKYRVGVIGCGRIAVEAHLSAYTQMGVSVTGICDVDQNRLDIASLLVPTARRYTNFRELASSGEIDIIDLTTRPNGRPEILRELVRYGKPILSQKPVCYSLSEAFELLRELTAAGLPIAVNHNARWSPANVRLKEWIDEGRLGKLYSVMHVNRFNEDKRAWYTDHPDYLFLDHGLHYIDLVRWLSGLTPTKVSATTKTIPGQKALCPLQYDIRMSFADPQLSASLHFNNGVPAPGGFHCVWFIDGTNGSAIASLDTLTFVGSDGERHATEKMCGGWVPDGFMGTFEAFARSLEEGTTPPNSLADHIETLRVATMCAQSANTSAQWVDVQTEVQG